MAEVLEAMGFPSEWCEKALKSTSGLETAVDLLLQWQAHGMPQFLPSSVKPSSPPHSSSSSKSVHQQQQSNSRALPPGGGPTLRLFPVPSTASKAAIDEREQSPSSTLLPSTSSTCPSSLDGPSGVNHPCDSGSPSCSFPRDVENPPGSRGDAASGRVGPSENPPAERMSVTGISVVEGDSLGPAKGASSTRTVGNLDTSDAVVPDAYAEERKGRYLAARRAKQEKEDEKARIRQHMQEDMALRRFRRSYQSPHETDMGKLSLPAEEGQCAGGSNRSRPVSIDTVVELQIRCPGNQIMKASFTAGDRLKDVRAYVEHQLQQPVRVPASEDHYPGLRAGSVPFTGQSARLSSDRQAEREFLQAARENFEVQTSRILASARTLRSTSRTPQISNAKSGGTIYFLIPFPRREFFTESTMESTLAEAQLVPRGSVVVQYRPNEVEQAKSMQVRADNCGTTLDTGNVSDESNRHSEKLQTAEVAVVDEYVRSQKTGVESEDLQKTQLTAFEEASPSFNLAMSEIMESGRTLEIEGERVRVRERALQAAAKRMTEAAKIFRAGLPLEKGETGEAFHFPTGAENQNVMTDALPLPQLMAPAVPLPKDNQSVNGKARGADAELLNALNRTESGTPGADRSRDALHYRAMVAAERRIRSSQPQATVVGGGCKQDPDEAESRIVENESESRSTRGKARVPQSSQLLSRPEKLQRTSNSSPSSNSPGSREVLNSADQLMIGGSSSRQQAQISIGNTSRAGPLEAALQRFKATSEVDSKGKAIVEEHVSQPEAVPSSSDQQETERNSLLRVRLEDGNVVLHTFPANALLQSVRDSLIPEGAIASDYGFVVPFPEPHFVEGDSLVVTLEEVGLVPRGTVHLTKLATRGMVRQGRRVSRRRRYMEESDDEFDGIEGMFRHLTERLNDQPDLTYEELMELEESIGRVHVGVPEEVITTLPTHIVKARKVEAIADDKVEGEEELDLCIVCMAEMVDGEEALTLPCFHTFHTECIRQWLLQATCCPTCKQALV